MKITKAAAKTALGLTSDEALADILECTRQAVHNWEPDRELSKPHQWMLYGKFPEAIPRPSDEKANAA